jgi:hypothetical protein
LNGSPQRFRGQRFDRARPLEVITLSRAVPGWICELMDGTRQKRETKPGARPQWAEGLSDELRKGRETIVRSQALLARLEALLMGESPDYFLRSGRGGDCGLVDLRNGCVTQTPHGRHSRTSELS